MLMRWRILMRGISRAMAATREVGRQLVCD